MNSIAQFIGQLPRKLVWLAIGFLICLFFYPISYYSLRTISENSVSVEVNYPFTSSCSFYILEMPDADEKLESGIYEPSGRRSWLMRLYRPLEEWEVNFRYQLRH